MYRTRLDVCDRLWFIDTGTLEYSNFLCLFRCNLLVKLKILDGTIQIQRPSIWIIDMNTEQLVRRFEIPESIVQPGHGMASITVDVNKNNCNGAFAYIPDLLTYHLYVYRLDTKFRRIITDLLAL